jgi:hypothetical protein
VTAPWRGSAGKRVTTKGAKDTKEPSRERSNRKGVRRFAGRFAPQGPLVSFVPFVVRFC